ncbi:hypothetical protein ACFL5Y_04130 [Candidatus Omnitrophota bacterium]
MLAERLFHEIDHDTDEVNQVLHDLELYRYYVKNPIGSKLQDAAEYDAGKKIGKIEDIEIEGFGESSLKMAFGSYFGTTAYFRMIWDLSERIDDIEEEKRPEEKKKKKEEIPKIIRAYLERINRKNSSDNVLNFNQDQKDYAKSILEKLGIYNHDLFGEKIFGMKFFDFFKAHKLVTDKSPDKLFDSIYYKGLNLFTIPIFPVDDKGEIAWEPFKWAKSTKRAPPKKYFEMKKISLYEYIVTHSDKVLKFTSARDADAAFLAGMRKIDRLTKKTTTASRVTHILIDNKIPALSQGELITLIKKKTRDPLVSEKIHFLETEDIEAYLADLAKKKDRCDRTNTMVFLSNSEQIKNIKHDVNMLVVTKEETLSFVNLEGLIGIARSVLNKKWDTFRDLYTILTDEKTCPDIKDIERWAKDPKVFAEKLIIKLPSADPVNPAKYKALLKQYLISA